LILAFVTLIRKQHASLQHWIAILNCGSTDEHGTFLCKSPGLSPNIDFETGNLDGWTCYIGSAGESNGVNMISLQAVGGPVPDRQTMYTNDGSDQRDEYGGFPVNCPNGSGHSVRLGNNIAGTQAEGLSYTFTIPANQNIYSLIYYYAVVFQDPNHDLSTA
jgi:hypothetical protein